MATKGTRVLVYVSSSDGTIVTIPQEDVVSVNNYFEPFMGDKALTYPYVVEYRDGSGKVRRAQSKDAQWIVVRPEDTGLEPGDFEEIEPN